MTQCEVNKSGHRAGFFWGDSSSCRVSHRNHRTYSSCILDKTCSLHWWRIQACRTSNTADSGCSLSNRCNLFHPLNFLPQKNSKVSSQLCWACANLCWENAVESGTSLNRRCNRWVVLSCCPFWQQRWNCQWYTLWQWQQHWWQQRPRELTPISSDSTFVSVFHLFWQVAPVQAAQLFRLLPFPIPPASFSLKNIWNYSFTPFYPTCVWNKKKNHIWYTFKGAFVSFFVWFSDNILMFSAPRHIGWRSVSASGMSGNRMRGFPMRILALR